MNWWWCKHCAIKWLLPSTNLKYRYAHFFLIMRIYFLCNPHITHTCSGSRSKWRSTVTSTVWRGSSTTFLPRLSILWERISSHTSSSMTQENFSSVLYLRWGVVALFPGLPQLQFLITCSMQKLSQWNLSCFFSFSVARDNKIIVNMSPCLKSVTYVTCAAQTWWDSPCRPSGSVFAYCKRSKTKAGGRG